MLDRLRTWAARQIAPKVPKESKASQAATAEAREAAGSGRRSYWGAGAAPTPGPAEKRKSQQEELLQKLLASGGSAGWVSDHVEEANQCSGWTYVATDARAKRVASAEVEVYLQDDAKAGEEGRTPVRPDHPLKRLLTRPNKKYDLRGLLYRIEQQLSLTGTALIWDPPNGLGLPAELWVLPTSQARPVPPNAEYPEGAYWVSILSLTQWAFFGAASWNVPVGAPILIDARNVVRIGYPHPATEADGLSPVWANGQAIDVATEADEALWASLQQGPMPSGILSIDPGLKLDQSVADDLTAEFESKFGGSRNAGKVITVSGGTYQKTTFSPSEIIGEALRTQNRDNVLAMGGVPAIAGGIATASAYSGLYAALQQFNEIQIDPELAMIAGALTLRLAARFDRRLVIILKLKPLNDPDLRLREAQQKHQSGCYIVDEIRAVYGDGPHPDPAIGKLPAGQAPQTPQTPGATGDPAEQVGIDPGLEADSASMDDTGQTNPMLAAAPTQELAGLRTKLLRIPAPLLERPPCKEGPAMLTLHRTRIKAFDESKIKRDHGKFSRTTGSSTGSRPSGLSHAAKRVADKVRSVATAIDARAFEAGVATERRLSKTKAGRAALASANVAGKVGSLTWKALKLAEHMALTPMRASQRLALKAAKERGESDERLAKVAKILKVADFIGGYVPGAIGLQLAGPMGGKIGSFLPSASLAYLAFGTAKNPKATIRAARSVIRGTDLPDDRHKALGGDGVEELLSAMAECDDDDWFLALLHAALDAKKGNLPKAIAQAKAAYAKNDGSREKSLSGRLDHADPAPYGYCPECRSPGVTAERRRDGNVRCANGHEYPRAQAKYSSTQVELTGLLRKMILDLGARIAEEDLGEDGRENAPHVTVRYGLHTNTPATVGSLLKGTGQRKLKLRSISAFLGSESNKPYDVLKIDIDSADLHELHEALAELPHTDTHSEYHPHATIGYVKAGLADKYLALPFEPTEFLFDTITFSSADRKKSVIHLSPGDWWSIADACYGVSLRLKAIQQGPGFTGIKKDSRGREYYWVNGKRTAKNQYQSHVQGGGHVAAPTRREERAGRIADRVARQRAAWAATTAAMANPGKLSDEDLAALPDHLATLTVRQLAGMKRLLFVRGGRLKADLVARVKAKLSVAAKVGVHPPAKPATPKTDTSDIDMSFEAMDPQAASGPARPALPRNREREERERTLRAQARGTTPISPAEAASVGGVSTMDWRRPERPPHRSAPQTPESKPPVVGSPEWEQRMEDVPPSPAARPRMPDEHDRIEDRDAEDHLERMQAWAADKPRSIDAYDAARSALDRLAGLRSTTHAAAVHGGTSSSTVKPPASPVRPDLQKTPVSVNTAEAQRIAGKLESSWVWSMNDNWDTAQKAQKNYNETLAEFRKLPEPVAHEAFAKTEMARSGVKFDDVYHPPKPAPRVPNDFDRAGVGHLTGHKIRVERSPDGYQIHGNTYPVRADLKKAGFRPVYSPQGQFLHWEKPGPKFPPPPHRAVP